MDLLIDPLEKIPEHLKCPICMEVPENKVFQCREGHSLCELCYSQIQKCPQCRIPFGKEPIRTLAVEIMLDDLRLECPYKNYGCNVKMGRKSFPDHVRGCSFGQKHAPLIKVCKAIGLGTCDFEMNSGNVPEAIQHFKNVHGAIIANSSLGNQFSGELQDFANYQNMESRKYLIILNQERDGYVFLFLINSTFGEKITVTWNAFYLQLAYPSPYGATQIPVAGRTGTKFPYRVKCCLKDEHSLTWDLVPMDILKCEDQRSRTYALEMPAHLFVNRLSQSLMVKVKVKKNN